MNQRENLLSLLRRQGYEYMPVSFDLCPSLVEEYNRRFPDEPNYYKHFNFPFRCISDLKLKPISPEVFLEFYDHELNDQTSIDIWGVGHEKTASSMHMTYMHNPLKSVDSLERMKEYPFPDYFNGDASHQKQEVDEIHAQGLAAMGGMQCTIWETAWYMRSMEELMMDMMSEDDMATYILDEVTKRSIHRAVSYAKAGVDIVFLGDDIGMQNSIMMSLELYRTWIKPRLKLIIDAVKKVNPDILVFYHSCGYVTPFIEDLIEVGVDVLNPIQSECMSFEEIHNKYGNSISFLGTIGTQITMPFGTPEEVAAEVMKNLDIAGKKGGLFVTPTHLLEPEVPFDNILAYVKACEEYRP